MKTLKKSAVSEGIGFYIKKHHPQETALKKRLQFTINGRMIQP